MSEKSDSPKKAGKSWLSLIVFALIGAAFGAGIARLGIYTGKNLLPLRAALDAVNTWDLLLLPVSVLLVLAVHEAGHLFGGFLRGMRFLLYIVGPLQLTRTTSGIRFNWVFNLGTFGGLAAAAPDPARPIRPQLLSLIAGGPLASLALAGIGMLLLFTADGRVAAHGLFIGFVSALIFLVTALPSRAGGFMSDGMQFIEVLRGGNAVLERQQITTVMAQSMAGVRPRDWNADWLQPAALHDSTDPLRRVAVRQLAMLAAEDRGDAGTADAHAEWLAEHTDDYPMGFRQSLTLELCLHAMARGNPNGARMWMAQSKGGVVDKARRALAEAELAFAEGDKTRAFGKELEARSQLNNGMDAGLSRLTEERLDALIVKLANKKPH
jgi:hypothetical protein